MKVGYKSDIGNYRENNEDSLFVDKELGLFIIADGMGGHEGGEIASSMAVKVISGYLKDKIPLFSKSNYNDSERILESLKESILLANKKIMIKANSEIGLKGMGTTVVLALFLNDRLYIAHVGDSRAYLIREKTIKQLTEDHSVVMQMVKEGIITIEETKKHHLRHILSQAVGTSPHLRPDLQSFHWKKGDYFLFCTDGLTDTLDEQRLLTTILNCDGDPQKGCETLINLANIEGGRDNVTAILIMLD